jgi:hypothetical protein
MSSLQYSLRDHISTVLVLIHAVNSGKQACLTKIKRDSLMNHQPLYTFISLGLKSRDYDRTNATQICNCEYDQLRQN